MIIVLDTNVVVSGVLNPHSKAATILRLVAEGKIRLAYDLRILSEYREVLYRSRLGLDRGNVDIFLVQIEEEGLLISGMPLKYSLPDPDDEPFLEVAIAAKVAALVTGNKRHFPQKEYEGVRIISPADFLKTRIEK